MVEPWSLRPRAGQPEIGAGDAFKRRQQHVKALYRMKPTEREQQRRVVRRRKFGAARRSHARRIDEIREIVRSVVRPAVLAKIGDDIAGVADEMIAMPIVFEIVIAAEPGRQGIVALRRQACGAVHPGENDPGVEPSEFPPNPDTSHDVERAAEAEFAQPDAGIPQACRPRRIAADEEMLILAGVLQSDREAGEEDFGTAMARPGHDLDELRHGSKSSQRAATSVQDSPC